MSGTSSREDVVIDWDGESPWAARAAIKAQDARFCLAVRRAHPDKAPPKPRRPQRRIRAAALLPAQAPRKDARNWQVIVAEVAFEHDIRIDEVLGSKRTPLLVIARQELWYRLAAETAMSSSAIGRKVGRDHTTVLHGIARHKERMLGAQG